MAKSPGSEPIPAGKFRAIERLVKSNKEVFLGDFDSFQEAEKKINETFKSRGIGWYGYTIYNGKGVRLYSATATKKKWLLMTKTTFRSETYSTR